MTFNEFKNIYKRSVFYKAKKAISAKIEFIRDFTYCDNETAHEWLKLLEG